MNTPIGELLLRRRWLIAGLIMLIAVVWKVVEHTPAGFSNFDLAFLEEVLVYSIAVPLFLGMMLTLLAYIKPKSTNTDDVLTNTAQTRDKQRVFVIENERLLGAGVEKLLSREPKLDVIGISPRNEKDLIKQIRHFLPNVVVLDEATYLTHSTRLLALLRKNHELRLVIVNANDNLVHIYHKQNLLLTQPADLVSMLTQNSNQA